MSDVARDDTITNLALAAGRGDRDAANAFIQNTQRDVWRFLVYLAGPSDAEDLTQETFVRGAARTGSPRAATRGPGCWPSRAGSPPITSGPPPPARGSPNRTGRSPPSSGEPRTCLVSTTPFPSTSRCGHSPRTG